MRVFGDPPEAEAIRWIQDNTPKDAIFLTNWEDLYSAADKTTACSLLQQNQINYVMISLSERSGNHFKLNETLFKNRFKLAGAIPQGSDAFTVYDVKQCCGSVVSAAPG